ncbi:site-specific integrase [Erysipelothrix aquatica]|uniref:site-specific integrase n=1 Tax=Erysipelothrix aquatica TaxID=2683714 RepID=UPI00135C7546|nr:site-specific integrase [Erysipelothrix aquatica]
MAVYKIKDRWLAKVNYRDINGSVKTKEKRFPTKREAQNFETDFRRQLQIGYDENVTYSQMVNRFIEWNSQRANERTIKDKTFLINKFTENISNKKFSAVSKHDFMDIYIEINYTDWSVARKNRALMHIRAVSDFAYKHYDFTDRTKLLEPFIKTSDDVEQMKVWLPEQLDLFLSEIDDYTLKALFHFQFYSGARIGETRALLKSDISNETVSFNKSIRSYREGFNPLKNTSSKRTIRLDDSTINMIKPLLLTDGDFLFGGPEPIGMSTIQRAFENGIRASGVPKIKIHDLRHSHATLLINRGANIVAVSKRLGHSDVQTTLRTYTHLLQESDDALMKILENVKTPTKTPTIL